MRVAITVLILSRLIQHVHAVSSTFISTDRTVAKVARMLAEVAAVEAIVALIYIIMVGLSSHWQQIAFPVLEQTQVCFRLFLKTFSELIHELRPSVPWWSSLYGRESFAQVGSSHFLAPPCQALKLPDGYRQKV